VVSVKPVWVSQSLVGLVLSAAGLRDALVEGGENARLVWKSGGRRWHKCVFHYLHVKLGECRVFRAPSFGPILMTWRFSVLLKDPFHSLKLLRALTFVESMKNKLITGVNGSSRSLSWWPSPVCLHGVVVECICSTRDKRGIQSVLHLRSPVVSQCAPHSRSHSTLAHNNQFICSLNASNDNRYSVSAIRSLFTVSFITSNTKNYTNDCVCVCLFATLLCHGVTRRCVCSCHSLSLPKM